MTFGNPFGLRSKAHRYTIATYPDGTRHTISKTPYGWQYHPRGSCASPLAVAKNEARDEGAVITTEVI